MFIVDFSVILLLTLHILVFIFTGTRSKDFKLCSMSKSFTSLFPPIPRIKKINMPVVVFFFRSDNSPHYLLAREHDH